MPGRRAPASASARPRARRRPGERSSGRCTDGPFSAGGVRCSVTRRRRSPVFPFKKKRSSAQPQAAPEHSKPDELSEHRAPARWYSISASRDEKIRALGSVCRRNNNRTRSNHKNHGANAANGRCLLLPARKYELASRVPTGAPACVVVRSPPSSGVSTKRFGILRVRCAAIHGRVFCHSPFVRGPDGWAAIRGV